MRITDEGATIKAVHRGQAVPVKTISNTRKIFIIRKNGAPYAFIYNNKHRRVEKIVPMELLGQRGWAALDKLDTKVNPLTKTAHAKAPPTSSSPSVGVYIPMDRPIILGWRPLPKPKKIKPKEIQLKIDTPGQRRLALIFKRDGRRCVYCQTELFLNGESGTPKATIDHVIPRSKGGKNEDSNCVASCADCNGRKADRLPADYFRHLWGEDLERCPHELNI